MRTSPLCAARIAEIASRVELEDPNWRSGEPIFHRQEYPVYQHNADGTVTKWPSMKEAAEAIGVHRTTISESIRTGCRAGRCYWSHTGKLAGVDRPQIKERRCRLAGVEYASIAEAVAASGMTRRRVEVRIERLPRPDYCAGMER